MLAGNVTLQPNKSTTHFLTSNRWSPYVISNYITGWLTKRFQKQIPLYFRNRWSQRCQIWHAAAVCQGPSSNLSRRNSGCGPGLGELSEIWGFPFNISAMAEASDFKFGTQLAFAKAHHKITPRWKSGGGLRLENFPKILGFPIIFLQRLGLRTWNGTQLGFAKEATPR